MKYLEAGVARKQRGAKRPRGPRNWVNSHWAHISDLFQFRSDRLSQIRQEALGSNWGGINAADGAPRPSVARQKSDLH